MAFFLWGGWWAWLGAQIPNLWTLTRKGHYAVLWQDHLEPLCRCKIPGKVNWALAPVDTFYGLMISGTVLPSWIPTPPAPATLWTRWWWKRGATHPLGPAGLVRLGLWPNRSCQNWDSLEAWAWTRLFQIRVADLRRRKAIEWKIIRDSPCSSSRGLKRKR